MINDSIWFERARRISKQAIKQIDKKDRFSNSRCSCNSKKFVIILYRVYEEIKNVFITFSDIDRRKIARRIWKICSRCSFQHSIFNSSIYQSLEIVCEIKKFFFQLWFLSRRKSCWHYIKVYTKRENLLFGMFSSAQFSNTLTNP